MPAARMGPQPSRLACPLPDHALRCLSRLARGRKFGFDPERAAFAMVLQCLCRPGSDLQGAE